MNSIILIIPTVTIVYLLIDHVKFELKCNREKKNN